MTQMQQSSLDTGLRLAPRSLRSLITASAPRGIDGLKASHFMTGKTRKLGTEEDGDGRIGATAGDKVALSAIPPPTILQNRAASYSPLACDTTEIYVI